MLEFTWKKGTVIDLMDCFAEIVWFKGRNTRGKNTWQRTPTHTIRLQYKLHYQRVFLVMETFLLFFRSVQHYDKSAEYIFRRENYRWPN